MYIQSLLQGAKRRLGNSVIPASLHDLQGLFETRLKALLLLEEFE